MDWLIALNVIATFLLYVLVLGIWKPWGAAYAGEKGKNVARKEDLDKILTEVQAVTTTQKTIEAKLSGELWERQVHWAEKKSVYGSLLTTIHEMLHDASAMERVQELKEKYGSSVEGAQDLDAKLREYRTSLITHDKELLRLIGLAAIFTRRECVDAVGEFITSPREITPTTTSKELGELFTKVIQLNGKVIKSARIDLGIDPPSAPKA